MPNNPLNRIRARVASIMDDKEGGGFFSLTTLFFVISVCFGAVLKLRGFLYQKGFLKTNRLPCKVISVGNLAVGGTGKTPMTLYLAGLVQRLGYRPVVISRGYKGRAEKSGGIVSNGKTILMTAEMAGDEPVMMAENMKNVPVLVGRDRFKIGLLAMEKFSPDVIILDDAFQHLKLSRDIDLVLLDDRHPFGNHHLLPRGILREPVSALARGSAFVMTRFDESSSHRPAHQENLFKGKPMFKAMHTPYVWQHSVADPASESTVNQGREFIEDDRLRNYTVYAFSGIVGNSDFRGVLKGFGCRLVGYSELPDHHPYTFGELEDIFRAAKDAGAEALATTEKDYARIRHQLSLPLDLLIVGIEMTFADKADKEDSFDAFIEHQLSHLP